MGAFHAPYAQPPELFIHPTEILEQLYPSLAGSPTPEERLAKRLREAEAKGIKPMTEEMLDRFAQEASEPPEDDDMEGFDVWLRLSRNGGKLPQGCSPAEKLAAFEMLAEMEGVEAIRDPRTMTAKFWPKAETADEIVAAVRALRRQGE